MSPRKTVGTGFSLPELVMAMAVLALLSTMAWVHAGPDQSRQTLDRAAQSFVLALDRARLMARRHQQACGLPLDPLTGTGHALPSCGAAGPLLPVVGNTPAGGLARDGLDARRVRPRRDVRRTTQPRGRAPGPQARTSFS